MNVEQQLARLGLAVADLEDLRPETWASAARVAASPLTALAMNVRRLITESPRPPAPAPTVGSSGQAPSRS
jgi:hypothetical protein